MLTAHDLDQKFEHVPLGEAQVIFAEKSGNQSQAYMAVAIQKPKKKFYEEEPVLFEFCYEDMVVLAARLKDRGIANLHEIIWKFTCAAGDVEYCDPNLKGSWLIRGRKPFYVTPGRIFYEKRNQISYCLIRMCAMYLLCHFTDMTLKQIGAYVGGRHHTTAIHGRKQITNYLRHKDPKATKVIVRTLNRLESYF